VNENLDVCTADDTWIHELTPLLFFLSGDCKELHCQLMTFGIPTQLLPINTEGDYNLEHVKLFLESRRALERSEVVTPTQSATGGNSQSDVSLPGPLDVLLGRDKVAQSHRGNVRYLHLIESYMDRYDAAHRHDKKKIAIAVTNVVKHTGGRFLESDGNGWLEVDNEIAIEKASTAFRSRRKVCKRAHLEPKTRRKEENDWACCNERVSTYFSGGAGKIRDFEPLNLKR
jgi:hypothetical protein